MSFAAAGPLNHGVSGVVFIVASLLLRPSSKRTYLAGPVIAGSSTAAVREQTRPETERLSVTAGPRNAGLQISAIIQKSLKQVLQTANVCNLHPVKTNIRGFWLQSFK